MVNTERLQWNCAEHDNLHASNIVLLVCIQYSDPFPDLDEDLDTLLPRVKDDVEDEDAICKVRV